MRKRSVLPALLVAAVAVTAAACGSSSSSSSSGATSGGGGATSAAGNTADFQNGGFPTPVTPQKGGILKAVVDKNIDCWNGLSYYGLSWSVYYFMARSLYGYPNTVKEPDVSTPYPDLASAMPTVSADGMTYTVKLRPGLTFPDGTPVTSKDVKSTYEYMLDPNIQCNTLGPPASGYYSVIKGADAYMKAMTDSKGKNNIGISGITTPDNLTTVFQLNQPSGSFIRLLAMGWSYIREASQTQHKSTQLSPPYVGPYKITNYVLDKSMTIAREPTWAKDVAAGVPEPANEDNIDGIQVTMGVPQDIQLQEIKSNQADISFHYDTPSGSDVPALANDPTYKDRFFSTPDSAVSYGIYRNNKPPFDNATLRKAVNYAVDRETLVKIAGGKLLRAPWSQILSQTLLGQSGQPGDVYPFTPDVNMAKQLIAQSGVPTPINIELDYQTEPPAPDEAASVKANLDAVGFNVTLKGLDPSVYYGTLADPKSTWNLAMDGWGEDFDDAITFYKPLLSCPNGTPAGSNYGSFCDPAFDASMNKIDQLPTGTDRTNQFAQLSTDTMKNSSPWWPFFNRRSIEFLSNRVGNFIWAPAKQWYFGAYYLKQ
jgi:ABC-type transport system substrate-binding protein